MFLFNNKLIKKNFEDNQFEPFYKSLLSAQNSLKYINISIDIYINLL